MALRSRLRELFQDAQPGGVITVEEPPSPAGASWVPRSPPASPPRGQGPLPKDCAVFQCRSCWAVLGDSLHLCAQEEQRLGLLVCFKVTNDVTWEDSLMIGLEGALLGCAYNALSCRLCGLTVGFILYSASKDLAYLRGLFCFFKDRILCYILKNQMIIEASKVNFPTVTLKKQLQEVKEKLVKAHIRIELLMKKLEELEQKNNVAEGRALHQVQMAYCQDMQ
ncbi:LOW QUALITY PROTEIN: protein Mis18-beta [Aquila chrysaetos chrysaetos]|uniref:LOW QUALITY PROTEIN: protein Mis18-beta n=1 Tax=Aquila chrysaetos chrysaetos TaxID=223781 RepID=UPI0005D04FD8|nr:LOW QUALITY PROTEIN: protein Mis18-beta [Aquila chrysaetos chrysaetos]